MSWHGTSAIMLKLQLLYYYLTSSHSVNTVLSNNISAFLLRIAPLNTGHIPDLLTQVGFGILAELALSTLWDIQGYDRVP